MNLYIDKDSLPVYEALASEVRLNMIRLLAERPRNVKELAKELYLSSSIVTMHVRKLEEARIIKTERKRIEGGTHKICHLDVKKAVIDFPDTRTPLRNSRQISIPIGQYTDFCVYPTCGLATKDRLIGHYDDPRFFWDPERVHAGILWMGKGYIEYQIPNYMLPTQKLEEVEISMEIGSEAPGYDANWPSDISFYINGTYVGQWTSPGDFGEQKGRLNPPWWNPSINQHGLLKNLRINGEGTYMDGEKISCVTLPELDLNSRKITLRLAVPEDALHVGGITLYGKDFGNYEQDIVVMLYYTMNL